MKYIKSLAIFFLATLLLVSCKEKLAETNSEATKETKVIKAKKEIAAVNLQTASFTIKGMTCEIGCAKTIEEELNGLDGVKSATVNFEKELATVSFDKTVLDSEKITKVVEATSDGKSYKVSNMKF